MFKCNVVKVLLLAALGLAVLGCASQGGAGQDERGLVVIEQDTTAVSSQKNWAYGIAGFSPDGKMFITKNKSSSAVLLWDTASGRQIRAFEHPGVVCAAFSPDGKQLVSGGEEPHIIKLWDIAGGRELRTFTGHTGGVNSVAFSPDGKQILSGSEDKTVKLWDIDTGKVSTYRGHSVDVSFAAMSPDKKRIFSGSVGFGDRWVYTGKIWDTATGREVRTFKDEYIIALSSDGTYAAFSVANLQTIKIRDTSTWKTVNTYKGVDGILSPDGKQLLYRWDDDAVLLDVMSGKIIRRFPLPSSSSSYAFSPVGTQILFVHATELSILDTASGRKNLTVTPHSNSPSSVAFSPDGSQVLCAYSDHTIRLWDTAGGRLLRTYTGHQDVRNLQFSPNGKQFITRYERSGAGLPKFWDLDTGRLLRDFKGYERFPYSPDGKQFFSFADGTMTVYDAFTAQELRKIPIGFKIKSTALSPDGKQVLVGSNDRMIHLMDPATGQELRTFKGSFKYGPMGLYFSPDGKQFLSDEISYLQLWDIATGKKLRTFKGNSGFVAQSISFSPDGKQLLYCTLDTVFLWDTASGEMIRSLKKAADSFRDFSFERVQFSPDGKKVLITSEEGSILRDAATWEVISTMERNTGRGIAFSPDGKQLLAELPSEGFCLQDAENGREIARFVSFSGSDNRLAAASRGLTVETVKQAAAIDGDWIAITPDGYYQASPRGDSFLNVRVGNDVYGIDQFSATFYNPQLVQARLAGKNGEEFLGGRTATLQNAASMIPPSLTITSPAEGQSFSAPSATVSVSVSDRNQPIRNIKVLVNGRIVGFEELQTVTGSSAVTAEKAGLGFNADTREADFSFRVELDPGSNTIDIVAFNDNAYEAKSVTVNAAGSGRRTLPNLWILAIGVNRYNNAGNPVLLGDGIKALESLNFAANDASAIVDTFKRQEGRRYAKVNSLLIADGKGTAPTAANIREGMKFLEQADSRDVVLLFLAGHGIIDRMGTFCFLPQDAVFNTTQVADKEWVIVNDELLEVLSAPGHRLVFIDACQSGGVDNTQMVRALMNSNAAVFSSSESTEYSYEMSDLFHGAYTYSIIRGLGGASGSRTMVQLSSYVLDEVVRITGDKQHPRLYSKFFFDLPITQ